jgi:serine/threonine protein kinase
MKRATIYLVLKLTAKTLEAESPHGKSVILKLTDKHEIEVLRRLHDNQSTKQTRIIPLLDVLDGRLMVLPRRSPLRIFLFLKARVGDAELLALQFLEAVAYLQQSSVAHLDLKPDNIVVQQDPMSKKVNLAIIDFNSAVFADVEPTISEKCGTRGWRAPEVTTGKSYNPLLADRWSCGRVLKVFTEEMGQSQLRAKIHLLSRQLMDPDPTLRPPVDPRDLHL